VSKNLVFSTACLKFANEKFVIVNRIMDIISRLKLFLEQNGISNSQFADTCGIPRPTLSQLLNGRNKKVSD
jgi:predicted XRE-type DNA-binding protein